MKKLILTKFTRRYNTGDDKVVNEILLPQSGNKEPISTWFICKATQTTYRVCTKLETKQLNKKLSVTPRTNLIEDETGKVAIL